MSLKRLLLGTAALVALVAGGSAMAADLRVKPIYKAPPPVEVYNWTGFYIGGHVGWAWTDTTWVDPRSNANLISDNGIGGGQVGFNWQTGAWVIGVEAQASWTHIRKGWTDPDPSPPFWTKGGRPVGVARVGTTVDHLGWIAGRIGYAFDRWLLFAKGGGAWLTTSTARRTRRPQPCSRAPTIPAGAGWQGQAWNTG